MYVRGMAEADQFDIKLIQPALKGSGFPFQTAIRYAIRTHPAQYRIHASEYPWRNRKNEDSFLDLVANNRQLVLTIECKKTKQENYIFLLPEDREASTGDTLDFRSLRLNLEADNKTRRVYCEDHELQPRCPAAEFCVVSTNSKERMLERDAAMLISATDSFACDGPEWRKLAIQAPFLIIPVLITNAEIYTVRYKPPRYPFSQVSSKRSQRSEKTFHGFGSQKHSSRATAAISVIAVYL